MNYNESIAYLEKLSSLGINLGLERVNSLVSRLGNPEKHFKSILIAGTNGKGSVAAMLEAILLESGFRVGTYTSPHLMNYQERIRVNGKDLNSSRFAELISKVKKYIDGEGQDFTSLTLFEVLTVSAFLEFSESKVDYALLEVGLGARLDATNVVEPLVSVITNVDHDHTEILGQDIEKISFEKAGVIREKIPLVTAAGMDALKVIADISEKKRSPLYFVRDCDKTETPMSANYIDILEDRIGFDGERVSIKGKYGRYDDLLTPLIGRHQAVNLGVTLGILEALKDKGVDIGFNKIKQGLLKTRWRGRFEIVSRAPFIILDGAHNPAAARTLKKSLEELGFERPLTFILGILSNKDIKSIVKILAPLADKIISTRSKHPKAASPEIISQEARKYKIDVSSGASVMHALKMALDSGKDQTICVAGSLFTVADAIEFFE